MSLYPFAQPMEATVSCPCHLISVCFTLQLRLSSEPQLTCSSYLPSESNADTFPQVDYKALASHFPSMKDEHSARTAWNQLKRKIASGDNGSKVTTNNVGINKACVPKKRASKSGAGDGDKPAKRAKKSESMVKEEVNIKEEGTASDHEGFTADERVGDWLDNKSSVEGEPTMDEEEHAEGEEEAV